ncbi:hypothetical protein TNIN_381981 [Trichonephila inaurata madagascariensis]|uniref:Uncharacterized protein n=1 Tax=Trichonephila inaurata madagascariensis TaxID=2747483 RepID=A0A8X6Y7U4_9ARAC|nr:hypothetical protein TNIN_381981 [Trichonephila inaurata madagascariensis]
MCQIIWQLSDRGQDNTGMCLCSCSDGSMSLPEISVNVEYKGFRKGKHSCSCEEFLIPRLQTFISSSVSANDTCEVCECEDAYQSQCKENGMVNFNTKISVVITTIWAVTACILLVAYCQSLFRPRTRTRIIHRNRVDYVPIDETVINERQQLLSKNLINS